MEVTKETKDCLDPVLPSAVSDPIASVTAPETPQAHGGAPCDHFLRAL